MLELLWGTRGRHCHCGGMADGDVVPLSQRALPGSACPAKPAECLL